MRSTRRRPTEAEMAAKAIIRGRSQGLCEIDPSDRGEDASHRRAAGQGGLWRAANLLFLCRHHHAWLESRPSLADDGGWRFVHRDPDPMTVPVWLNPVFYGPGWYLLDDEGGYLRVDGGPAPVLPPGRPS